MVQVQTSIKIIDNSGAKLGKCIKVLTPKSMKGNMIASVGDLILVTLKRVIPLKKVKKGTIYKALLVRSKKILKRVIGYLFFEDNAAILLNKKDEPIGSRISGIIGKEIRELKFTKIVSLVSGII